MSTPILQTEPSEIDSPEKRRKHPTAMIGCGYSGILQAILFADADFKVTCADADESKVSMINKGKIPFLSAEAAARLRNNVKAGNLSATSDFKEPVSRSDIIVLTTSAKINAKKRAEYSDIENICKKIGSNLQKGSLTIVTSLTGVGITEGLIKETLENTSGLKVGTDIGLAYAPFHPSYDETLEETIRHPQIVAATDKNSLRASTIILEKVTKKNVTNAASVRTAELTVLLGILQQDIRLAFTNEAAILCEKVGVDLVEAQKAMGSDTCSLLASPSIIDDVVSDYVYLLLDEAENFSTKLRIASAARNVNEEAVRHVTNIVKDALKNCGKTQKRARVGLLGASVAPNIQSPIQRNAKRIIETLEARGAKVSLYDPYVSKNEIVETPYHFKKTMTETVERADVLIILTAHDQFKRMNLRRIRLAMRMPAAIVDIVGIVEPSKIEKEGFIYRGIGRGV
jgi:nucleotide sugar dehydrogenase